VGVGGALKKGKKKSQVVRSKKAVKKGKNLNHREFRHIGQFKRNGWKNESTFASRGGQSQMFRIWSQEGFEMLGG